MCSRTSDVEAEVETRVKVMETRHWFALKDRAIEGWYPKGEMRFEVDLQSIQHLSETHAERAHFWHAS